MSATVVGAGDGAAAGVSARRRRGINTTTRPMHLHEAAAARALEMAELGMARPAAPAAAAASAAPSTPLSPHSAGELDAGDWLDENTPPHDAAVVAAAAAAVAASSNAACRIDVRDEEEEEEARGEKDRPAAAGSDSPDDIAAALWLRASTYVAGIRPPPAVPADPALTLDEDDDSIYAVDDGTEVDERKEWRRSSAGALLPPAPYSSAPAASDGGTSPASGRVHFVYSSASPAASASLASASLASSSCGSSLAAPSAVTSASAAAAAPSGSSFQRMLAAAAAHQQAHAIMQRDSFPVECVIRALPLVQQQDDGIHNALEPEQEQRIVEVTIRPHDASSSSSSFFHPPLSFAPMQSRSLLALSPAQLRAHQQRLALLPPLPPTAAHRRTAQSQHLDAEWSSVSPLDRLSRLPDALLLRIILPMLSAQEVALLSRLSRRWNRLANDRLLWVSLCRRRYHRPQVRMDPKQHFISRLAEEHSRVRRFDAVPSEEDLAREMRSWPLVKKVVSQLNSGTVGVVHCLCWVSAAVVLTLKVGGHLPGPTVGPDVRWSWAATLTPLWVSHALYDLSLLSFALLAALPRWWRQLHSDLFGLCSWIIGDEAGRSARFSRGDKLSFQGIVTVTVGLAVPLQLASVLAVVKLDRSASCRCEDQLIMWRDVMIPFLFPFVLVLLLLVRTQLAMWASDPPNRQGGCIRRYLCCWLPRKLPDKALVSWFLEVSGFTTTVVMLCVSVDTARRARLNLHGADPADADAVAADADRFYRRPGWAWWCLAPMWIAHASTFLYLLVLFLRNHSSLWRGTGCCVALLRLGCYTLASVMWHALLRAPLIVTEVLLALNYSAEWGHPLGEASSDVIDHLPSSSFAPHAVEPRIDPSFVALPLALCLGLVVLCLYCPVSVWEIRRRRLDQRRAY